MYYFYYTVDEWCYKQPMKFEKSIKLWASPTSTNSYMPPLSLALICAEDMNQADQSLNTVEFIDLGHHYDVEKLHEGCLSVSDKYFQDIEKALFATCKSNQFSVHISIGSEQENLNSTEILDFDFEVTCQTASIKKGTD